MSDPEQPNGADVALDAFGVKANVKNVKSLNTGVCLATLLGVILIGYVVFEHKADARTHGESLTAVMKDMAQAIREGNCINSYPEAERENKIETCKRITR